MISQKELLTELRSALMRPLVWRRFVATLDHDQVKMLRAILEDRARNVTAWVSCEIDEAANEGRREGRLEDVRVYLP